MPKTRAKADLADLYKASAAAPREVMVPKANFLMIDGEGDPNTSPAYREAVEALFALAYAIRFMLKKGPEHVDFKVMPLEGLWWANDLNAFKKTDRSKWKWTAMILQPSVVTAKHVADAKEEVKRKKKLPALARVRFASLAEGRSAQILHVGPFSEEGPTIQRLHSFIADCGKRLTGKHHEIYLSDVRRAKPEKWKTVVRQPMA